MEEEMKKDKQYYEFLNMDEGRNRVLARAVKPREFILVSDAPLTFQQIEQVQDMLGFDPGMYRVYNSEAAQRVKLGMNILKWRCYDVC